MAAQSQRMDALCNAQQSVVSLLARLGDLKHGAHANDPATSHAGDLLC